MKHPSHLRNQKDDAAPVSLPTKPYSQSGKVGKNNFKNRNIDRDLLQDATRNGCF
jgi:hypothetical protein